MVNKCNLDYCDNDAPWEGSLCRGHLSQQARGTVLKPLRTTRKKGEGWYYQGYKWFMIKGRKITE